MAAVPSVRETVERLKDTYRIRKANRSSISYHIDYLADQKLPVNERAKYLYRARMHSKHEALVAFALRFALVREEHLALLSPEIWQAREVNVQVAKHAAETQGSCLWAPERAVAATWSATISARRVIMPSELV